MRFSQWLRKNLANLKRGNITPGTVKVLAAGAVLKPQYGDSPQYYSASIPFIADSIVLRANQPFVGSVARAGYQDTELNIIDFIQLTKLADQQKVKDTATSNTLDS
jgi:hypothetical protein